VKNKERIVVKYRESKISAHHNYLVNEMPTPGFVVGNPDKQEGFYFLGDIVLPEESTPRISCRLLAEGSGNLLLEMNWNRIQSNPEGCIHQSIPGGFQVVHSSGDVLLEVRTQAFANGYLTRIKARFYDENGDLRMETRGDSIRVYDAEKPVLDSPFSSLA
jgi:hypothetical protein